MPPAQRKITVPENSTPWKLHVKSNTTNLPFSSNIVKDTKVNSLFLKLGILTKVKGSAYIETGETKILAAVQPPRENNKQIKRTSRGSITCDLKYDRNATSFENSYMSAKNEKYLSISIEKALQPAVCLHNFPNFEVEIVIYVIQDDGCVLSSAINCIGAALANGGVPMFDVVAASTALVTKGNIVFNPNYKDFILLNDKCGIVTLAQLASHSQITECFQVGNITMKSLINTVKSLSVQNDAVAKIIKHVLHKRVKNCTQIDQTVMLN